MGLHAFPLHSRDFDLLKRGNSEMGKSSVYASRDTLGRD